MPYESEKGIDEKQEAILNYIKEYQATSGHAPSVSEIVLETGMGISAVNSCLEQLERAGYIEQNRFGIKLAVPTPLGNYLPRGNHLTTDRKLRVFLCHASQDKPVVRELRQRLLAEGWIEPWLDEEELLPGQDWDTEIEKAVETADVVIVCLSNKAVTKEGYIQKEIRFALNFALFKPFETIFIVPLRLDECVIPRSLHSIQYIDYFPQERVSWAYQRLLQSLQVRAESIFHREVIDNIDPKPARPTRTQKKKRINEERLSPAETYDERDLSEYYPILLDAQRSFNGGDIQHSVAQYYKLIKEGVYLGITILALERILELNPDNGIARSALDEAHNTFNSRNKFRLH